MAWPKDFSHRQGNFEHSRSRRTELRVLVQRLFCVLRPDPGHIERKENETPVDRADGVHGQLVESFRNDSGKVRTRVVANLGRVDQITPAQLDPLIHGLNWAVGRPENTASAVIHARDRHPPASSARHGCADGMSQWSERHWRIPRPSRAPWRARYARWSIGSWPSSSMTSPPCAFMVRARSRTISAPSA